MSEEKSSCIQCAENSSDNMQGNAEIVSSSDEKVSEKLSDMVKKVSTAGAVSELTEAENFEAEGAQKISEAEKSEAELQKTEAELDALDNMPENKRHARIVLTLIVVLLVFSIATIVLIPPMSWSPQKGMKSEFHTVSAVEKVQPGVSPELELAYQPLSSDENAELSSLKYALHLEQETKYEHGSYARIEMDADIVISKPAKRDREDEIDIHIENAKIVIRDEKSAVPTASTGTMISGISVRALLDPRNGMSSIIPPATKINPQTARILFTVSDALRQILPPLPEGKIGKNAEWELRDIENEGAEFIRRGKVKAKEVSLEGVRLETVLSLYRTEDSNSVIGNGEISSSMKAGVVRNAEVHYHRNGAAYKGGALEQDTKLTFEAIPVSD